jgi:glutaredoxin
MQVSNSVGYSSSSSNSSTSSNSSLRNSMGFISPSKNNDKLFTVYTKSKCIFCVKAKYLLVDRGYNPEYVDCDEYLQDDDTKEKFIAFINRKMTNTMLNEHRTFPMIFYRDRFIGGYNDLFKYFYDIDNGKQPNDINLVKKISDKEKRKKEIEEATARITCFAIDSEF